MAILFFTCQVCLGNKGLGKIKFRPKKKKKRLKKKILLKKFVFYEVRKLLVVAARANTFFPVLVRRRMSNYTS